MAASDSAPRPSPSSEDAVESAAGMAHLTVVPANFDPDDSRSTEK